ncbi:MAG: MarR family transcriptional regulator [Pseudomonadota bacterium]
MKTTQKLPEESSQRMYLNLQKIFRSLSFGKSLKGQAPSLTGTQMRILTFFNEKDVVYISEISRTLGMSVQSVNNLVARLEAMDYVERSKNIRDKRLSDIRLTSKGREGFDAFRAEQLETLSDILSALKPAERKVLSTTIEGAARILETAGLKISNNKQRKG